MSEHRIEVIVNGEPVSAVVEGRRTLVDFLRVDAGRTGVHVGCEHGVCGACTIILDGRAIRSCLMLAVQADGASVTTAEGLAAEDGALHPVQQAMKDEYGLQCGFCTPGVVMTLAALTAGTPPPSEETLRDALSGHLCRCTGYQGMLRAARRLAAEGQAKVTA
jgi:carbon-monoxide dehydrogenase small subunit